MGNIIIPKPIMGGFLSIQWIDKRHYYWNEACRNYTAEQWHAMVREMAVLGQKYIVIFNVSTGDETVYDSKVQPKANMVCDDPLEVIMTAADMYDMKVFLSNDYYKMENYDSEELMLSKEAVKARFTIMEEVAEKYTHHKSFYGWYWAWESCISPYFSDRFIKYFNDTTAHARTLTPKAKFLTAPYGTINAVYDDKYIKQLEMLDADIVAYQDTVGCYVMDTDQSKKAFETLRKVHDKVPQRALWADVETFDWEGPDNVRTTALIPAKFERLEKQLAAVSPYVDEIIVFIFQGLLSDPNSIAYTGYEKAGEYYNQYKEWLKKNHPDLLKNL